MQRQQKLDYIFRKIVGNFYLIKKKVNCDQIDNTINYKIDVEERAPREKTRLSTVEVTWMHLTYQDLAESTRMLKEVALSI